MSQPEVKQNNTIRNGWRMKQPRKTVSPLRGSEHQFGGADRGRTPTATQCRRCAAADGDALTSRCTTLKKTAMTQIRYDNSGDVIVFDFSEWICVRQTPGAGLLPAKAS